MRPPLISPQSASWTMRDGYAVRGRFWPGMAEERHTGARIGVVYLHGIQSHGGWYEWSGSVLASCGLMVAMPDRRGSGLNSAARGDVPATQQWFDDVEDVAAWMTNEHGVARLAVVGVSWGGKLAFAWAHRRQRTEPRPAPSEVLLIAPGLFPRVGIGFTGRLSVAWSCVANPTMQVPIPLSDPALFTSNPAGRSFIASDPHKLTHVTGRFLYHSHMLDRELTAMRAGVSESRATLLLAGADRIIRNESTQRWLRRVCAAEPLVETFAAAGHTIEFETRVDAFEATLRKWASGVAESWEFGKNAASDVCADCKLPI